jgi:hypothetical protein
MNAQEWLIILEWVRTRRQFSAQAFERWIDR